MMTYTLTLRHDGSRLTLQAPADIGEIELKTLLGLVRDAHEKADHILRQRLAAQVRDRAKLW